MLDYERYMKELSTKLLLEGSLLLGLLLLLSKSREQTPPSIATITLSPANPSVSVNHTIQMVAACKDSSGNLMQCGYLLWTIENTNIASVDSNGLVTTTLLGTTTIRATALSNLPTTGSSTLTVI